MGSGLRITFGARGYEEESEPGFDAVLLSLVFEDEDSEDEDSDEEESDDLDSDDEESEEEDFEAAAPFPFP